MLKQSTDKNKIADLYVSGMSAREVSEYCKIGIDAVYYALRYKKITRRSARENSHQRFQKKPLSYSLKKDLSDAERRLKLTGIILYWAEGYKTAKSYGIDFANSDPEMVSIFKKFLSEICAIDEKRLKISLFCYSTQSSAALIRFWSELLEVPKSQFTKPYVKIGESGTRGHRMKYGLVHLRYSDKKLLAQVLEWIEEYKKECVGGGVVNRRGL